MPLVEYTSLEEDEDLQERWANLVANIVTIDGKTLLKQNCLEVLKRISNDEAKFLDHIFALLLSRRIERFESEKRQAIEYKLRMKIQRPEDYPLHTFTFSITKTSERLSQPRRATELTVSNLVALGLIKWVPEVNVLNAEKSDTDPDDQDLDIDLEVFDSETIRLTNLGYEFIELCQTK